VAISPDARAGVMAATTWDVTLYCRTCDKVIGIVFEIDPRDLGLAVALMRAHERSDHPDVERGSP
jgi:hypothetical protein